MVTIELTGAIVAGDETGEIVVPIKVTRLSGTTTPATLSVTPQWTSNSLSYTVSTGTAPSGGGTAAADTPRPVTVPTSNQSFIDVRYGNLLGLALAGLNPTHMTLTGPGVVPGLTITEVVDLGDGTFRYLLNGSFRPGQVNAEFNLTFLSSGGARAPPSNWKTTQGFVVAGTSADAVRTDTDGTGKTTVTPLSGRSFGRDWINGLHYIEVRFTPTSGFVIDPTTVSGDELRLVGPGGAVITLGTPVRVGTTDTWRYSFSGSLAAGAYTLTIQPGTFADTGGVSNQGETEEFTVVQPASGLSNPLNGSRQSNADFNSRGWVDVTFAGAKAETVLDGSAEFSLATAAGDTIVLVGAPVRLGSTDTYRYFFAGLTSTTGVLTFTWSANSWVDSGDVTHGLATATDDDGALLATGSPASTDIASISNRTWLDVVYTPAGTATVVGVNGDELATITGLTKDTTNPVFRVGDTNVYRYLFTGDLAPGVVTVVVTAGTWTDSDGNAGAGSTSSFTLIQPAQSFFIEISGGLQLRAPFVDEPLIDLKATVVFEVNPTRKLFILTFDGQLSLIKLGVVGSTSGRFVLDLGDGTSSTPGFWGVATLETNFSELEQYGLYLFVKGTFQINTTGVQKTETITLKGIGDGDTDVTRTFVLEAGSFSLELVGQARIRPPDSTTDLLRLQGGFFIGLKTQGGFELTLFATAELSFGVGSAQLTFGSATALVIINEDGIAGSIKIGAGGGLGLPNLPAFSASGSVQVVFNTMRHDVTFVLPDSFRPLLINGDPGEITIFGSAPGFDGLRNPNAPAGGEIYVKAIVEAHLVIGGVVTLDGFISITAAVDPNGGAYLKIDGAMGAQIPLLGAYTATLNLAVYVGGSTGTGVVGRIQITRGASGIPGISFSGQFLVEINTFSSEMDIQTFAVRQKDVGGGVMVFDGFEHDAAGRLVITEATLAASTFTITLAGDLRVGDTLTIQGNVLFTVTGGSNPRIALMVYGRMSIAPLGNVTVSGGFDVSRAGLVAWLDVGISINLPGLTVGAGAKLGLNTTGVDYHPVLSPGITVQPGFLLRIQGNVTLLTVQGEGFVEVRVSPTGFELQFDITFEIGGLEFGASGAAGVYSDGFALRLAVHAKADALIFSLDASGTIEINTTGQTRLGIARGFLLDVTGEVSILKVLNFDAHLRVEFKNPADTPGGWAWHLHADASVDFFGLAKLSGSIDLYDNGDFRVDISGGMTLGSSDYGLVGNFHFLIYSEHYEWTTADVAAHGGQVGTYYRFGVSGGASVKVRAFGITLAGVGLDFSVTADSRLAGADGRVKIALHVHVEVEFLFFTIEGDVDITLGYIQLPPPVWMGSDGTSVVVDSQTLYRHWDNNVTTAHILYLNVGDRAFSRNIGVDDTNESVIVEQIGGTATDATIKVTAFGRSNTYQHVSEIRGSFAGGNDNVLIKPGVLVPVVIDGGAGNDSIAFEGTSTCNPTITNSCTETVLSGGIGNDFLSAIGYAILNGDGGNDTLMHFGSDAAILNGGDNNDKLYGSSTGDRLNGEGGDDVLTGPAKSYSGGAGVDLIIVALTGTPIAGMSIDGGDGSDTLIATFGALGEVIDLSDNGTTSTDDDDVLLKYRLKSTVTFTDQVVSNVEVLNLDAGAGADDFVVHDLKATPVTGLVLDLGRTSTSNGTRLETTDPAGNPLQFPREVPDVRYSDDRAADTLTVEGSATGADEFTLTTTTLPDGSKGTHLATNLDYGVDVKHGIRGEGDTLVLTTFGGADDIDASATTADAVAIQINSGTGGDTVVGSPYADRIDSGLGDDTVTGGDGRDVFIDAGGDDTLVESFDRDFFLSNNLFVVGQVTSKAPGTGFASGIVEDLDGIFENAELTGGPAGNTFLIGDLDGTLAVPGGSRTVTGWTGDVTILAAGGDDLVVVATRDSVGSRVHITGGTGSDRLVVDGTDLREDITVGRNTDGRDEITSTEWAATEPQTDNTTIDHAGLEDVLIRSYAGGDRVLVRRINVTHTIDTGVGDDEVAVGSNAGFGTRTDDENRTVSIITNASGVLDYITRALELIGGEGTDSVWFDDTGTLDGGVPDTTNEGRLTNIRLTGFGTASGVGYVLFESLRMDTGGERDVIHVDSTHGGPVRPSDINTGGGDDLVYVHSISGRTTIDLGTGDDVVRISSTESTPGVIAGIASYLFVTGGDGSDRIEVDDRAATAGVIGVLTSASLAGLGMTLTGSHARPSLVQTVTVANAFAGRFVLGIDADGDGDVDATTVQLDHDASAAKVQAALTTLLGAGNVVVTKAGGRWVIAYTGALAGDAGWARKIVALTVPSTHPMVGSPEADAAPVVTGFAAMTDGLVDYTDFEYLGLKLGSGSDVLNVDSTLVGLTEIDLGAGDDRAFVETLGGNTTVRGQDGSDWLVVNAIPDDPTATNPMAGKTLALDGGNGADNFIVGLFGKGSSTIAVTDTLSDGKTNNLVVNGSALNDTMLMRRNLIALLSAKVSGLFTAAERVTYTSAITGNVIVNGLAGDDHIVLDDNSAKTTVNGDSGNDKFSVGQLFTEVGGTLDVGIPTGQLFDSTRGWLSNGVSVATTINGGSGDDTFDIFRNKAVLTLNGETGDDTFVIRSFAGESATSRVNSGAGRDFIEYAMNAPVAIDGGEGFDTIVVIGTEFNDRYVVTRDAIYGAGRFVTFVNVERLKVYGMEGDDVFYVLSTNALVETALYGGLGSDRIEIAGAAPPVQSDDFQGHTGLVRNSVEGAGTLSTAWTNIPVNGVAAEIQDNDAPALIIVPVTPPLTVRESSGAAVTQTVSVRPTFASNTWIYVTLSSPVRSDDPSITTAVQLSLNGSDWGTSVTLMFAPGSTAPTTFLVRAAFDLLSEGTLVTPLQTSVTGVLKGTGASYTANTLTKAGAFAGLNMAGGTVRITSGAGVDEELVVLSNTADTLTLAGSWATTPDAASEWMVSGVGAYELLGVNNTLVRVIDDEATDVVVTPPAGGPVVVEPDDANAGGTAVKYPVSLPRAPLPGTSVTITLYGGSALQLRLEGTATWLSTLALIFSGGDWQLPREVWVRAVHDNVVTGERFLQITADVTSSGGRITGTVSPTVTGRADEFVVAATYAANSLRGHRVLITGGKGAGQIRYIEGNYALGGGTVVDVQGDWDIVPDGTSTFAIYGYDAPVTTGQPGGTVTAIDAERGTITIAGASLPTAGGGLAGALVRIVGKTGSTFYRTIASNTVNTITVTDPWGLVDPNCTGTAPACAVITLGVTEVVVVGAPGLFVDSVQVLVHDSDTPGVVIVESDGTTRLVEGALAGMYGFRDTFTVRLTRNPGGTVTVTLRPLATQTLDIGGPDCGLDNDPQGCLDVQLHFVAGAGQTVNGDGSLTLTFNATNWSQEQTVTVEANDDLVIDGSDLQAFADAARRTHLIQGPLFVSGGDDPNPPVQLTLDDYLPVLLPGETSGNPDAILASTADQVEQAQVDVLVVHNEDSPANDTGTLTRDQILGLGMSAGAVLSGVPFPGGIRYGDFEDLTVLLGYGNDTFTIESSHHGTTTVDAGAGADLIRILTLDGHTRILGRAGNDTFRAGSSSHLLDLLAAHLMLDGGAGADTAWLDDAADTNANLGWLTQTTLTGLDMIARAALDASGRPLDRLFTVVPSGSGGFTIVLSATKDGITTGLGAVTFAATATAAEIQSALQLLLFPQSPAPANPGVSMRCGTTNLAECADSVYVWATGNGFLIGFRGEVNEDPLHPVTVGLAALGGTAAAYDASSRDGISYYGLETLNLSLGSGSDVLNVRGTLPQTNVSFGDGDDRVYISSKADVGIAGKPEFLAGDLDDVDGTLNLDLGRGRHTLLISDEGTSVADTAVLMTDVRNAALDRDLAVTAAESVFGALQEIYLVGLAQGSITWRAASDGTFADGIRIWAGSGADTFRVNGTHHRAGVRTTTWLNTGLGNDTLRVELTNGQDGFFVLNTQGPNDNLLHLGLDLGDGDQPVAADALMVRVNGLLLDPSRYVVSSRYDTVGLFDSFSPGAVVNVATKKVSTVTLSARGPVSYDVGSALASGESVRVLVNGVWVTPTVSGSMISFNAGAPQDLAGSGANTDQSYVVIEITRVVNQSFTIPQSAESDDDVVNAETSTLPLVIFGGQGADTIHGGTGGDIVLADRGRVLWFTPGAVPPVTGLGDSVLTAAQLVALEAAAVAVSGHGGFGDKTDGVERLVGIVITTDPTVGAADVVTTGGGKDVVFGGAGGDTIMTDRASTTDLTDIVFGDHGFIDFVLLDGDPTDLDRIWSTDPTLGGDDNIQTGAGDDVVVGGNGADTILGGSGQNIVLGDNGRFTAVPDEVRRWGNLAMASGTLTTTDPTIGGDDVITTLGGLDLVLGGAGDDYAWTGAGDDIFAGDHATVTWAVRVNSLRVVTVDVIYNGFGGDDTVFGQDGEDVLIGGTSDDDLDGGTGRDLIFGDNVLLDRTASYGDYTNPRFQTLTGTQIYSTATGTAGSALADGTWRLDPRGYAVWGDFRIAASRQPVA